MNRILALALLFSPLAAAQEGAVRLTRDPAREQAVSGWLDGGLAGLVDLYRDVHRHPELSFHEFKTGAMIARELEAAGWAVTSGVGKTGVVGVLENGPGPTVLIRGDMDALPVVEQTGLPYASEVRLTQPDGTPAGAMHACGHDVHVTMVVGVGRMLAALREHWRGTVVLVAQPAEEIGRGAKAMIDDGLFERFPKPDFCLSLHVKHNLPTGSLGFTSGWAAANMDSVDITIYGKGGHGARPHDTVDPIVTAAHVITALQTLVSRRVNPVEPAVVTVGSIHGGSKHNIIPDEVKLQLTVRSYSDEVRQLLLDGIRQVATDTCRAMGCPKEPLVKTDGDEFTPACYNDPGLTAAFVGLFREQLGPERVVEFPAEMGAEDFGHFARRLGVPGLQYRVGTIPRERWEASRQPGAAPLPSLHSPLFHPDPEPTVRLSVASMGDLAMALLAK